MQERKKIFKKLLAKFKNYTPIYATGSLGNFSPFDKEMSGVKEAKILTKPPKTMNNKEIYYYSDSGSYLIEKYNSLGYVKEYEFIIKNKKKDIDQRLIFDFFDGPELASYAQLIYKGKVPKLSLGTSTSGGIIFSYEYDKKLIKHIHMISPKEMREVRLFSINYDKENKPLNIETINTPGGKEIRFQFKS